MKTFNNFMEQKKCPAGMKVTSKGEFAPHAKIS